MSTRANILIKDGYGGELWFYRHCDGYPDGAMPLLHKFMEAVKEEIVRDNVSQASGWLILLGAEEYKTNPDFTRQSYDGTRRKTWQCGAIEPTTGRHSDIEFLYTINLEDKSIKIEPIN